MPALNRITLIGNLTRDPELKFTPKGTAVADFGLAVNEKRKDANGTEIEETLFVDITFFGKVAEIIGKFLKKGQPVYVEGKLKLETWEDKTTGQNRSKMKVIGENFQFLDSPKQSAGNDTPRRQETQAQAQTQDTNTGSDDDIPF